MSKSRKTTATTGQPAKWAIKLWGFSQGFRFPVLLCKSPHSQSPVDELIPGLAAQPAVCCPTCPSHPTAKSVHIKAQVVHQFNCNFVTLGAKATVAEKQHGKSGNPATAIVACPCARACPATLQALRWHLGPMPPVIQSPPGQPTRRRNIYNVSFSRRLARPGGAGRPRPSGHVPSGLHSDVWRVAPPAEVENHRPQD